MSSIPTRLLISLLPLAFGWPMLAFCLCARDLVLITVSLGGVRGGIYTLITGAVAGLLCYICGLGASYGGFFALQLILAAVLCSLPVASRRSFRLGMMAASVSYGLGEALSLRHMANDAGLSIADYIYSQFEGLMSQSMATMDERLSAAGAAVDTEGLAAVVSSGVKSCVPGAIITGAMLAGYVLMWLISRSLRGTPLDNRHSFASIRLGLPALCFGAAMLAAVFLPGDMVKLVGLNGLIVFMTLAFAAGLSLMEFLLRLKIKGPLARVGVHALIFVGSFIISALLPFANIFLLYALLGVVDCFVSIRKKVTASL